MKMRQHRRVRSASHSPAAKASRPKRWSVLAAMSARRLFKRMRYTQLRARARWVKTRKAIMAGDTIHFRRINPFSAMPPPGDRGDPLGSPDSADAFAYMARAVNNYRAKP